jgi:hypothetical protein
VGSAGDPQSWNGYSYVRNNPLRYTDPTGMDGEDWAGSQSIAIHRDTGCSWECQQLRALAGVGWSYEQWQGWQHEQLVGALQYVAYQNELARSWTQSTTIAQGGGSGCDTACQWLAAARAYERAGERAVRERDDGGGGCGVFGVVCSVVAGVGETLRERATQAVEGVSEISADAASSMSRGASGILDRLNQCDWKQVAGGSVLMIAGGTLTAGSVAVGMVVIPAEIAAAPETGGMSLLLLPHTAGVVGAAAGIGAIAFYKGGNVVIESC